MGDRSILQTRLRGGIGRPKLFVIQWTIYKRCIEPRPANDRLKLPGSYIWLGNGAHCTDDHIVPDASPGNRRAAVPRSVSSWKRCRRKMIDMIG